MLGGHTDAALRDFAAHALAVDAAVAIERGPVAFVRVFQERTVAVVSVGGSVSVAVCSLIGSLFGLHDRILIPPYGQPVQTGGADGLKSGSHPRLALSYMLNEPRLAEGIVRRPARRGRADNHMVCQIDLEQLGGLPDTAGDPLVGLARTGVT